MGYRKMKNKPTKGEMVAELINQLVSERIKLRDYLDQDYIIKQRKIIVGKQMDLSNALDGYLEGKWPQT